MDQFEAARLKHFKNQERYAVRKERAQERNETPEKREPQIAKLLQPAPKTVMQVSVSGPEMSLSFEVDYGGALIASQLAPENLRAAFKKQLSAFGRVNDVS